jgi:hypothetical protein
MSKGFLNDTYLREIKGRLKLGGQEYEAAAAKYVKPQPKPWSYPTHPMDEEAEQFGLKGFELKVIQDYALRHMRHNAALRSLYKQFLMMAKLSMAEELDKIRQRERRISEDRSLQERSYQNKLRQYEGSRASLLRNWTETRSSIRTRWRKVGRDLVHRLEGDASINGMSERELIFLGALERRGILNISEGRVLGFSWDTYEVQSIEDIKEVMDLLDIS